MKKSLELLNIVIMKFYTAHSCETYINTNWVVFPIPINLFVIKMLVKFTVILNFKFQAKSAKEFKKNPALKSWICNYKNQKITSYCFRQTSF